MSFHVECAACKAESRPVNMTAVLPMLGWVIRSTKQGITITTDFLCPTCKPK